MEAVCQEGHPRTTASLIHPEHLAGRGKGLLPLDPAPS